jgi:hypothetical protein
MFPIGTNGRVKNLNLIKHGVGSGGGVAGPLTKTGPSQVRSVIARCERSILVFRRICLPARRFVPMPLIKRSFMKAGDQAGNTFPRLTINWAHYKLRTQHFGLTTVNLAPA